MDKAAVEQMLSQSEQRHKELTYEALRVEGEYRVLRGLLNNWQESDKAVKAQKGKDAKAKPRRK